MESLVYLAKGKRGIVYVQTLHGKKIVVKKQRPGSQALRALENEAIWLRLLNRYGVGPRFHSFTAGALSMEYISGTRFEEWLLQQQNPRIIASVVRNLFDQCFVLDQLHVDKKEMHKPFKHILICRGKPILIDFERCKKTLQPKNVTQFCQYLLSLGWRVDPLLLRPLLKEYKKTYSRLTFARLVDLFCS